MAFLTPVRRLRGSVVYSYDRSHLTGRSGRMYDHHRYYYDNNVQILHAPECGRFISGGPI